MYPPQPPPQVCTDPEEAQYEDEDNLAAIEFVCACNYFILMTGCAPHLLHPVTLFMMLCSEPCIEDGFTNAYPFKVSESCTNYLNNMK